MSRRVGHPSQKFGVLIFTSTHNRVDKYGKNKPLAEARGWSLWDRGGAGLVELDSI
jgi:hypothetical protein